MRRTLSLVLAAFAAGCTADATDLTAPVAHAPGADQGVVASVTGSTYNDFSAYGLVRSATFSARELADGRVSGQFQITLRFDDGSVRPVHFAVECLEVDGNRAWIGGRIVAPKNDPYLGYTDVWYVEDGGESGPDRVGGWLGYPAELCETRPNIVWAEPTERGELTVRDDA